MTDSRDQHLAHNENLFRSVNENIASLATNLGRDSVYEFLCECASTECFERLSLKLAEYEAVRSHREWFLVKSGHEDLETEFVAQTHGEYLAVEKNRPADPVGHMGEPAP